MCWALTVAAYAWADACFPIAVLNGANGNYLMNLVPTASLVGTQGRY